MIWVLPALAQAPPDEEVSEEVIVWQRPFARFDDQRWEVHTEVITPATTPLGTPETPVRATAWQLDAVIHCRLADPRGRLREVRCAIEDAALRVHVPDTSPDGREAEAIRTLTDRLKGAELELAAHKKGKVPSSALEGLGGEGQVPRRLMTGLQTVTGQIAAAFHMEFPAARDPRGHTWVSYTEPLLLLASPVRGMGASEVLHRVDVVDGRWIQQTRGRATSTTRVPNPDAGLPCGGPRTSGSASRVSAGASDTCAPGMLAQPDFLDRELIYATELNGLAVVSPDAGFPVERTWTVTGQPTAGSGGTVTGSDYWSAGLLRHLGPVETATLGPSGLVAAPGQEDPDLPAWVPVDRSSGP